MGLHVIAVPLADFGWVWVWTKVLVGLGLVIFVHELGHFLVAKLCRVKVEKFYLGFDIGGLKLLRFRHGQTEYGIGILPLGGYVKMLGQEDNPARLRAEIERARSAASEGGQPPEAGSPGNAAPHPLPSEVAAAEQALFDPQSYLAKSVPKRMAIISAGVVMNLVFAVLAAMLAYGIGVEQTEGTVGEVFPGEAAWRADLKPGDRIEQVGTKPIYRFNDLVKAIALGDIQQGARLVIRREGEQNPRETTVYPDRFQLAPSIGITSGWTTTLSQYCARPGSPAARTQPEFQPGDQIVKISGQPVASFRQLHAQLALHPDKVLTITVQRQSNPDSGRGEAGQSEHQITIQPNPMRDLGLLMEMGPITAIQQDSPAAEAGIRPGDRICRLDGQEVGDPMRLPDRIRRLSESRTQVVVTVERAGVEGPLDIPVRLRRADWYETPGREGNPLSIPALGVAYQVGNRVVGVAPAGPAAQAGIQPGDVVVEARLLLPDWGGTSKEPKALHAIEKSTSVQFSQAEPNWPWFFYLLQEMPPGTQVILMLQDGRSLTLQPEPVPDWFYPDRGWLLKPKVFLCTARSLREAIWLGSWETWDALTLVFRTLQKLGTGQVSPKAMGGPVEIARQAGRAASRGTSELLVFLTLISANLALINFLPIPVLDGGHMVFLTYEGITGKLPSENVQARLTMAGLLVILTLVVWVCVLDFGIIPRH
ncbi:MAG: site-2 protease family protein [Thermoguttaceae bacterium]